MYVKKIKILSFLLLIGAGLFFLFKISSVYSAITWTQNDWSGGTGQTTWTDATKYNEENGINTSVANQATLNPGTLVNAYGGSGTDGVWSIRKTSDRGMILGGFTNSFGAGGYDGFLVKLDNLGNILWQKTYGGTGNEYLYSVQQTTDGGYVATGWTTSYRAGSGDIWVIKTDSVGNLLWQKTYGGTNTDLATAVIENAAGNYMILEETASFGSGSYDVWILELNPNDGSVIWQNVYGGTDYDTPNTPDLIKQTLDGGYIIGADSRSFPAPGYPVGSDLFVFKIDSTGGVLWQNVYAGIGGGASAVVVLADGSYLIGGDVKNFGAGNYDFWVLHLDASGDVLWQKAYGGTDDDDNVNIIQTSDGNFLLTGNSKSFGFGGFDILALKIDISGNILWQKAYGGVSDEHTYSMPQEMADGTYVIGRYPQSFGVGNSNAWILKLAPDGSIYNSSLFSEDVNVTVTNRTEVAFLASAVVSSPTITTATTPAVPSDIDMTLSPTSSSNGDNYIRTGVLTSSIFDAGTINSWGPLKYTATIHDNTAISFEVSTDGGLSWEPVTDYTTQTFGPSQTIAYRATLSNTDGLSTPILQSVSMDGSDIPVVITSLASSVDKSEATLEGNIIGIGGAAVTERGFNYGLDTSYGTTATESSGPYGAGTFSADLTDLRCETIYHYRAYATNSIGTGYGNDVTFTTASCTISSGGGGDGEGKTCQDHTATNYGGSLPCVYPPTTCQDSSATNYRGPLPCTYAPTTCQDHTATNYGGTLPCVYPKPITLCQDHSATNYGGTLPCVFPIIKPTATLCEDQNATNYGEPLPCQYTEPTISLCADQKATNYGGSLPCVYPSPITNLPPKNTNRVAETILTTTRVFTNNPTVQTVKNVAIAIPVTASLLALLAALLSGLPFLNYLIYLFLLLSQFLGFRRAPKPWGIVYDSFTKGPIPFARVEVLNEQRRKLQTAITDQNGRYGFLISTQTPNVVLQAYRTKYDFPSKGEPSIIEQKLYPSIYKGGTVNVGSGTTNYDLPMDPRDKTPTRSFYFGISSIKLNNVLTTVANILFVLGTILGLANAVVNPGLTSFSVLLVILFTLILRTSGFKLKPFGLTKDRETKQALPFSFLALHNEAGERMNFTVSDDVGRYFLLTPKGHYLLKAYTPSYVPVTRTREMPVSTSRGWISGEVEI